MCSLKCICFYAQTIGMYSITENYDKYSEISSNISGFQIIPYFNIHIDMMTTEVEQEKETDSRYYMEYAIIDSNGDDIPELNIYSVREFTVISFENGELTWFKCMEPGSVYNIYSG